MAWKADEDYFRRAIELSKIALDRGNDGFACVLVNSEGEIVIEQCNAVKDENDPTAHDAIRAISKGYKEFGGEYLNRCTLYATMEPCVMCMCGGYWAGLGAVKYAVSEKELNEMFGGSGLDIHSREFIERTPTKMRVEGPNEAVHDEATLVIKAWVDKVLG